MGIMSIVKSVIEHFRKAGKTEKEMRRKQKARKKHERGKRADSH